MSLPVSLSDREDTLGSESARVPEKRIRLWSPLGPSTFRAYVEIAATLFIITCVGEFLTIDYHALGLIYLLAVIVLSLRVPRYPAVLSALLSAITWNYVFLPPRMSFAVMDFAGSLFPGTYLVVALIGSQLTARVREEQQIQRMCEHQSLALLHLARALAAAQTLDGAATATLQEADELFEGTTALVLPDGRGNFIRHAASSLELTADHWVMIRACLTKEEITADDEDASGVSGLAAPLKCGRNVVGALMVRGKDNSRKQSLTKGDLFRGFAAQVALSLERESLRQASEREALLLESDRLHKILLDSVSHELKTPLAVLRAASEKLETADVTRQQILFTEVRTATQRLDRLVANLLTQSRIQSGRLDAQLDWCDVRDIVEAARKALGNTLESHRLTAVIPHEFPLLMADVALMEQVLCNLLLNAAKHTPVDTDILITADVDHAKNRFELIVTDQGPGIAPDIIDQLFKPFKRGAEARPGGVGIGLSIVKGFMLAQGGDVEVTPNPTGGVSFAVWLPFVTHEPIPTDEC